MADVAHIDLIHVNGGRVHLLYDRLVDQRPVEDFIVFIDGRLV